MSTFRLPRPLARGRLALLLTQGTLAGCAGGPVRLSVSPDRGPTVRASIGPLEIAGSLTGRGVGVENGTAATGGRRWSSAGASASAAGGERVDHVAIYAGEGRVIHAASGAGSVRYDDLDSDRGEWLLERFVTSRRVLSRA